MRLPFLSACPVCETPEASEVITFPQLKYARCVTCGLIYKSEQVERLGVGYEADYFKNNRARYLERWDHRVRKCRRQLLACLEYAPHARRMLDVGCSAGYVLEAGKSLGLEEMGLDYSQFAVALCRERGYRAEVGSLERMPFPDNSFDVVTLKHTLEHIKDPLAGLREIQRVLRPGGVALIVVPDANYFKISAWPRLARAFRPEKRGWQHHTYFYGSNLVDACSRVGMTTLKRDKAVVRRRLAEGIRAPYELLRGLYLRAWTTVCEVLRLRRELFHIVRKELEPANPVAIGLARLG